MIPNALPQTNIQHILYSVSYIPAPIPNRDLGCKFLVLYILKSQAFWTLVPNFVSKCEDLKLEDYGKVGRNVRSLRKPCAKPRGSLLSTTLVVMTLARGGSL